MDTFWENPTSFRSGISLPQGTTIWSGCSMANDRLELLHPALLSSTSSLDIQGIVNPCDEASLAFGVETAEMVSPSNCMDLTNNSAFDLDLLQYQQDALRVAVNSDHDNFMRSQAGATTTLIADAPAFHQTPERFIPSINPCKADDLSAILYSCENVQALSCSANISSGDQSENPGSIEAASQSSSNPDPHQLESLKGNAGGTKRKVDEIHLSSTNILQSKPSSTKDQVFEISFRSGSKQKKSKSEKKQSAGPSSIDFSVDGSYEPDTEAIAQVKEMIYRAAALRPVNLWLMEEPAEKPKRKNVRISSDPQTVAARHRRERISERLRVLQRLVPGGSKMDTASMLDEAANYLKFLKSQVRALETLGSSGASTFNAMNSTSASTVPFHLPLSQTFPSSSKP